MRDAIPRRESGLAQFQKHPTYNSFFWGVVSPEERFRKMEKTKNKKIVFAMSVNNIFAIDWTACFLVQVLLNLTFIL